MMHLVSVMVSTLLIICTLIQLSFSVSILNSTDFHLHIRNSSDGSPSSSNSTADGGHWWLLSDDSSNRHSAVFEVTIRNYHFHDNYRVTISDYSGGIVCDFQTNYTVERYSAVNLNNPYSPSSSYSISASCVSEDPYTAAMTLQPYRDNVFYLTVFSVETEDLLCNSTHLFFYTPASTVAVSAEVRGMHRRAVAAGTLVTAVFLWRYMGKYPRPKGNSRKMVEANHSQSGAMDGKGDHGSQSDAMDGKGDHGSSRGSWKSFSQPSPSLLPRLPLSSRYVSSQMTMTTTMTMPGNESNETVDATVCEEAIAPLPLHIDSTPTIRRSRRRRRAVFVDELDILRAYYGQLPTSSTDSTDSSGRDDDGPRVVINWMSDFDFYVIRSYFEQSTSSSSSSSTSNTSSDSDRPIAFRAGSVRLKNSKQSVG